jgi:hypothetical protein
MASPAHTRSAVVVGGATAFVLAASATAMAAGWAGADLTGIARAPSASGNPLRSPPTWPARGPVARVDYWTTAGGTEELSLP